MIEKLLTAYSICSVCSVCIIYLTKTKYSKSIKKMLKLTLDVFNKHNVPYWADFGTLLGLIREKDIIAHDFDADFGINSDNINKLYNPIIRNALVKKGLCLVKSKDSVYKIYYLSVVKDPNTEFFYKHTTHVDIFPYIFKPLNKIALRAKLNWHKESNGKLKKFNKNLIIDSFDLYLVKDIKKVWVSAWNNYCNIPKNYHKLLIYRYGPGYMKPVLLYKPDKKIVKDRYKRFYNYYDWDD